MTSQMNKNNLFQICEENIKKWGNFQPILLTSPQIKAVEIELFDVIDRLFVTFWVDKHHIHILKDDGESLKIETLRKFIQQSNLKSSDIFQIFVIENISRLTLQSANASLKFLEEPWLGNIIFLTNTSSSGVLETILSRVRVLEIFSQQGMLKDPFYWDLLSRFIEKKDPSIFWYFFQDKKLQKGDYVKFFTTLLVYIKEKWIFQEHIDQVEHALNLIEQTSVIPKYLVDRILFQLQK